VSHRVEKKGNFMVVNTIKPVICALNKILSRIGILSVIEVSSSDDQI